MRLLEVKHVEPKRYELCCIPFPGSVLRVLEERKGEGRFYLGGHGSTNNLKRAGRSREGGQEQWREQNRKAVPDQEGEQNKHWSLGWRSRRME